LSIWIYWLGVLVTAARSRFLYGHTSGIVPSDCRERLMWIIWVPVVAAWITLPSLGTKEHWLIELPRWAEHTTWVVSVRWCAAVIAAVCYLCTVVCWFAMGQSWSVGVLQKDHGLVTTGPFALSRHPIYSLSILMMICTVVVLPTLPMFLVAVLHVVLMHVKARAEEKHLMRHFGDEYIRYMNRVGRFLPRRMPAAGGASG
jgi:protein-S-isoprenylcysteine O-methyltransferase Ste14